MINGTPFPGTFMLDANTRVTSRFFEEFYRERWLYPSFPKGVST